MNLHSNLEVARTLPRISANELKWWIKPKYNKIHTKSYKCKLQEGLKRTVLVAARCWRHSFVVVRTAATDAATWTGPAVEIHLRYALNCRRCPGEKVREAYINFFVEKKKHDFVQSSPVVPLSDPTLLFANVAWMDAGRVMGDQMWQNLRLGWINSSPSSWDSWSPTARFKAGLRTAHFLVKNQWEMQSAPTDWGWCGDFLIIKMSIMQNITKHWPHGIRTWGIPPPRCYQSCQQSEVHQGRWEAQWPSTWARRRLAAETATGDWSFLSACDSVLSLLLVFWRLFEVFFEQTLIGRVTANPKKVCEQSHGPYSLEMIYIFRPVTAALTMPRMMWGKMCTTTPSLKCWATGRLPAVYAAFSECSLEMAKKNLVRQIQIISKCQSMGARHWSQSMDALQKNPWPSHFWTCTSCCMVVFASATSEAFTSKNRRILVRSKTYFQMFRNPKSLNLSLVLISSFIGALVTTSRRKPSTGPGSSWPRSTAWIRSGSMPATLGAMKSCLAEDGDDGEAKVLW